MTKTLMGRQWRYLRWFLMGVALLAVMMGMMSESYLAMPGDTLWENGLRIDNWNTPTLHGLLPQTMESNYAIMLTITFAALIAIWQQFDAQQTRNAQLVAAFPVRRGTVLWVQLISGIALLALMALGMGIATQLSLSRHAESLDLVARLSPHPALYAAENSPVVIWMTMFRLFMLMLNTYLGVTMVLGLFGNIFAGAAFFAGLVVLFYWFLTCLPENTSVFNQLFRHKGDDYSYRMAFANMFGVFPDYWLYTSELVEGQKIMYSAKYALLPFATANISICAVLLGLIHWQRRRIANEDLGGVFLFDLSRWAVVLLITGFALVRAAREIGVYSEMERRMVYNPIFPLVLLLCALVMGASWFFLIKRRHIQIRRNAMAVLMMLALFAVPAAAKAETILEPQLDASRIEFDAAQGQLVRNLSIELDKILVVPPEGEADTTDIYEDYYGSHVQDAKSPLWRQFGGSFKELSEYQDRFSFYQMYLIKMSKGKKPDQAEFCAALGAVGRQALADAYENRQSDNGMICDDAVRLVYTADKKGAMVVSIDANVPIKLKAAQAFDASILENTNALRRSVYSNGTYDTASYQWREIAKDVSYRGEDVYADRHANLTTVFQNEQIDRLMLNIGRFFPDLESPIHGMIDAAVAQGALSIADAGQLNSAIMPLVDALKSGNGSVNGVGWRVIMIGPKGYETIRIELVFS